MIKTFLFLFTGFTVWAAPTLSDIETLAKGIDTNELSIERLIEKMGETYPELREHFVLMHSSLSRQGASFEFPRVIARSRDARFVFTFNGDPNASAFQEIEMMEFSKDAADARGYQSESFKFRRIGITPNRQLLLYPVNEKLCQGCHEQRLRPNWESYNKWEGAYPETDEIRVGRKYFFDDTSPLSSGFDLFYRNQASQGRYRFLKGVERFVVNSEHIHPYPGRVDPSQFTQDLANLNYRRIAHLIFQSKEYSKFKFSILAALYNCDNFNETLPKSFAASKTLSDYVADTEKSFSQDSNNYFLKDDVGWVSKIRFLLNERGIPTDDWSMSFRRSRYSFVTPGGMPEGFLSALLIELDPSLEPYRVFTLTHDASYGITTSFFRPWTGSMTTMVKDSCDKLRATTSVN